MDSLNALKRLPRHRSLLERAVARFRDDDRVPGLVLGGSLALGEADFYSDVDLYVIVRDEFFDAVFAEREAAAEAVGPPLFRFTVGPVPGGSRDFIVTYPGPAKLDLMYYRESELEPDPKWEDRPVLKDDSGSVSAVVSRSAGSAPDPPTLEALVELEQKFWTWCWYVFSKISRGELWEALDGLHAIRSLALLPLLDRAAERPHEGYRVWSASWIPRRRAFWPPRSPRCSPGRYSRRCKPRSPCSANSEPSSSTATDWPSTRSRGRSSRRR